MYNNSEIYYRHSKEYASLIPGVIERYREYLSNHTDNVMKGFEFMCNAKIIPTSVLSDLRVAVEHHDESKYTAEEFWSYAVYFDKQLKADLTAAQKEQNQKEFDLSWAHHQKANDHHWQYWVLVEDDTGKPKALDMPAIAILHMICDWWAFSWKENKLGEIFKWYDANKNRMILADNTRAMLENYLKKLHNALLEKKLIEA